MPQPATVHNPFLMMLDPGQVMEAIERSEALTRLGRRLCRPLDKEEPETADGPPKADLAERPLAAGAV